MSEVRLADLRRYAIFNRTAILYRDPNGRQARVNRKGIIEIPAVAGAPPYNIEEVLAVAEEFSLEPEGPKAQPRRLTRPQMAGLLASAAPAAASKEEKEE